MRIYKTKEFARLAKQESIEDSSLRQAISRAERGLIDAILGKFLIKQRVARKNEGRSGGFRTVVFYRERDRAVFLHLFAKNDKDNLTSTELEAYRDFAKALTDLKAERVGALVELKKWIEVES